MDKYRIILSDNYALTVEAYNFEVMAETNNLYFTDEKNNVIAGFHMPQIKGFYKTSADKSFLKLDLPNG